MCALAEGSDHGGSLRNPASFCNVVGFRVSAGRVPRYPSRWVYDPFSVHGPMARTVRDAALMLSVMAGPDERVPISISEPASRSPGAAEGGIDGWRVAWAPDLGGLLRGGPGGATADRGGGAAVRRRSAASSRRPARTSTTRSRSSCRSARCGPGPSTSNELGMLDRVDNAFLKQFAGRAHRLGALDVADAEWRRSQLWERVRAFMERYEVLLLPGTQTAAFPKEVDRLTEIDGQPLDEPLESSLSTYAISMTGLPALSVPCGFTASDLPVGLQIVGRWRREADVLRAAAAFEDANPLHRRRPPLVDTVSR